MWGILEAALVMRPYRPSLSGQSEPGDEPLDEPLPRPLLLLELDEELGQVRAVVADV